MSSFTLQPMSLTRLPWSTVVLMPTATRTPSKSASAYYLHANVHNIVVPSDASSRGVARASDSAHLRFCGGAKHTYFEQPFIATETIILPRQARDKHIDRENSTKQRDAFVAPQDPPCMDLYTSNAMAYEGGAALLAFPTPFQHTPAVGTYVTMF